MNTIKRGKQPLPIDKYIKDLSEESKKYLTFKNTASHSIKRLEYAFEQVRILQHNQDINILNKIGVDIDDILICHAHIYELSNLLRDSLENLADEIKKCKTSYIKKINTQEHDK